MNKTYLSYTIAGVLAVAGTMDAAAAGMRLPIQEDKPVEMYAIGAGGTAGVYRLNLTDLQSPTKLNGSTYVGYTGSNYGGGGTFLNTETVVGVKYNYGAYPFEATAAGGGDGPWSSTYMNSSYDISQVYDMTYDEQADVIYCWYAATSYQNALGIYNPTSHTITRVGSAANAALIGLAIDNEGQLWGVGSYGTVYKVNKTTGVATEMTGGYGCGVQFQSSMPTSAAVDPASGVMYVVSRVGSYDSYSTLAKVDLNTFKAENLGALNGFYNCLYIAGSAIAQGAPAPVENLAATFNGTETVVTFTAPTTTAGGKALTGTLTYTVNVDGEEAATGSVEAGAEATVNITPADGQHDISVSVANAEGASKEVKTSVFSGYDQPGAVTALTAKVDGTDVTLTWDAPQGENGGLVNFEKVSYTVSCDGEILAEGLTTTTFETVVEGNYRQLTYAVTVKYGDEEGKSATADVMAGEPYGIPYALDLASVTSLAQAGIEVIDTNLQNSKPTETWEITTKDDETYLDCYKQAYWYMSDFAYLPPMTLKAGKEYTLTFQARAITDAWGTYNATLKVLLADKATTVAGEYTELDSYETVPSRTDMSWTSYEVKFTVEKDGTYNLGFLAWDQSDMYGNYNVNVKDVEVTTEVVIVTPQPVTDLEVVAQEDNNRNIDITFVLPTESTEGAPLTDITKVEIRRGTEVLETLNTDLVPGQKVTYTDENAPRGIKNYSVVVYCDEEASKAVSASVKVGYVNNLTVKAISWPDTELDLDETGVITVEVTNDGFEKVLDGAYNVILVCDGKDIESEMGESLATDESATYSFALNWNGTRPATVEYTVKVVFDGDENMADNETEPISVSFKDTVYIGDALTGNDTAEITAAAGAITVKGAAGQTVTVVTAAGTTVAAGVTDGEFRTAQLAAGVYVVNVAGKSVKVAL